MALAAENVPNSSQRRCDHIKERFPIPGVVNREVSELTWLSHYEKTYTYKQHVSHPCCSDAIPNLGNQTVGHPTIFIQ